ncbi:MAG TPA: hypothetical protein VGF69_17245 [Thermoanaerobaculia bacterium]|jgi:hypothetical protein
MTEFILRIFFSGLIAFVPNSDGTEISVVLVNTPHEYTLAGGDTLPHHRPMLLARAASCEGSCVTSDHGSMASFMFANKTPAEAQAALNSALTGGGAWELSGSDLTIGDASGPLTVRSGLRTRDANGVLSVVPATPAERGDFSWVADMSELAPGTGGFKTALTLAEPPSGCVVAARLKLRSGELYTYSLVKIDAKARAVHFRKPSGSSPEAPYAQAVANWVAVDIHIPGDSMEIVEQSFSDSTKRRTMRLRPQNGIVELALLNLPPFVAPDPNAPAPSPAPGQHFQLFYDLVKRPPAPSERLVPHQALSPSASDPQADWSLLHPRQALWSDLLESLGMSPRGKSPYDLTICPIIKD